MLRIKAIAGNLWWTGTEWTSIRSKAKVYTDRNYLPCSIFDPIFTGRQLALEYMPIEDRKFAEARYIDDATRTTQAIAIVGEIAGKSNE